MSTELVTLTIDGRAVRAPKGTLLVEAARQINLEIPVFCYHPKLKPVGACRMCLVTIEKMPRLQTACTTPVADGMVVHTSTPEVVAAQNGVLELLLANHPLDCPICDKGGECPLQDNTFQYGPGTSRFSEQKTQKDKAFPLSDRIALDKERCILCYRCTRFQAEIPGDEALAALNRGGLSEIGVLEGETFDSIFSGNTIELCPVGALTSREYRFRARLWDLRRTPSTCGGCAVGCNLEIHARMGGVVRLIARENPLVDDGWLCDSGRFDSMPPAEERRVFEPMVRCGETLQPASWAEAIERAAELLRGPDSGVVLSPALSNEAIWVATDRLRRHLAGSARLGFWPRAAAPLSLRGSIASLSRSKTVVLVGLDAWYELPVLALWIRKAVQAGGKLVVIGAANGLFRDTAAWLRSERGGEITMLQAVVAALKGGSAAAEVARAVALLEGRPASVLVGPQVAADAEGGVLADQLVVLLEAGRDGLVGSPAMASNGRGAQELASDLALQDPRDEVGPLSATRPARALLLVGQEAWPETGDARLVVASTVYPERLSAVEVLLPLAHPYEQNGSLTNLEGRVQQLNAGGRAPGAARMDWEALVALANALGANLSVDLVRLRGGLAEAHPSFASALSGELPEHGRVLGA